LTLTLPIGGYNGAALVRPDLSVIQQRLLAPDSAREAMGILRSFALDIWIFAGQSWLVQAVDNGSHYRLGRRC